MVAVCVDGSTPANDALDELAAHFEKDGRYRDRVVRKKPCVRLEYAPDDIGKFHVDVLPVRQSGRATPPFEGAASRRRLARHSTRRVHAVVPEPRGELRPNGQVPQALA